MCNTTEGNWEYELCDEHKDYTTLSCPACRILKLENDLRIRDREAKMHFDAWKQISSDLDEAVGLSDCRNAGPKKNCSDCGRMMVWDSTRTNCPTWICPRCVLHRMREAEGKVHELVDSLEQGLEIVQIYHQLTGGKGCSKAEQWIIETAAQIEACFDNFHEWVNTVYHNKIIAEHK